MKKLKITEMERLAPSEYKVSPKIPLVIVLDGVRSMNNVGAVFRTADAFRLEHIYLCGITGTPPHPDIHKTALGAEDSVPWDYYGQATDCISDLLEAGYQVLALEQAHGSISLSDFTPEATDRYALVLGNEVHGVSQGVMDMVSGCLEIPQYGSKHSINVSIAAGIAIWHIARPMLAVHLRPSHTP